MPLSQEILQGLQSIAENYRAFALLWHILIGLFIIAILIGWRPSNRTASVLLALPFLSVSAFAFIHGNIFNGILFIIGTIALVVFGLRTSTDKIEYGPPWSNLMGLIFIFFGMLYPHFLNSPYIYDYVLYAPTCLIPCPTLIVVTGFALIFRGFKSRWWPFVVAVLGLFYGFFGTFGLGVYVDTVLIAATITLLVQMISYRQKYK